MSPTVRVLVVDDYEGWRRQIRGLLRVRPEWQVVGEASGGLAAIQEAQKLKPELILLDIGMPNLNGIAAARRIRELVPESKILFVSQESDAALVLEALKLGASGYVAKTSATRELSPAVQASLHGERFVSRALVREALRAELKTEPVFHLEYDSENKLFQGRFKGRVTSESVASYYRVATLLIAGADLQGSITDFSDVTSVEVSQTSVCALPPMDPVVLRRRVIVAPNGVIHCLASLFQTLGKDTRPNLHIVQDTAQALALLGVTTPQFRPIEAGNPLIN